MFIPNKFILTCGHQWIWARAFCVAGALFCVAGALFCDGCKIASFGAWDRYPRRVGGESAGGRGIGVAGFRHQIVKRCCEDVRGCDEDVKMWGWEDVKKRARGQEAKRAREEDVKMWRWADVKMRRCEDEKMWRWEDEKMRRCEGCEDWKVWRWEDVKMRGCEDEKMWRWEDEIQTPTIGRTLRSDALGKNVQVLAAAALHRKPGLQQIVDSIWLYIQKGMRGWPCQSVT